MSLEASSLTYDTQTRETNLVESFFIHWTIPDPTYGQPPAGWYGVQSQYSEDGATWTDHYTVMATDTGPTDYKLFQAGQADVYDSSPRLLHWRLKTLYLYRGPLYSNVIDVTTTNVVGSGQNPASNFTAECQG